MRLSQAFLIPALAFTLLAGRGLAEDASQITSFEASEGFHKGGIERDPGSSAAAWTLPRGGRVFVSAAYPSDGALSLAMVGNGQSNVVAKRLYEPGPVPYTKCAYTFVAPGAEYQSLASTSWVYLFLKDEGTEAPRLIQLRTRFGFQPDDGNQIAYPTWDNAGTVIDKSKGFSPDELDLLAPNTISIVLDYPGQSYTIELNGIPAVANIPFPSAWKISNIAGLQLVSGNNAIPGGFATTYYDGILVATKP